jgi:hypothetical protein
MKGGGEGRNGEKGVMDDNDDGRRKRMKNGWTLSKYTKLTRTEQEEHIGILGPSRSPGSLMNDYVVNEGLKNLIHVKFGVNFGLI